MRVAVCRTRPYDRQAIARTNVPQRHSFVFLFVFLEARLLTMPNVVVTGHQAFFTEDALAAVATITMANLESFAAAGRPAHPLSVERIV